MAEILLESEGDIAAESITEAQFFVKAAITWMDANPSLLTPDQTIALHGLKKDYAKMLL